MPVSLLDPSDYYITHTGESILILKLKVFSLELHSSGAYVFWFVHMSVLLFSINPKVMNRSSEIIFFMTAGPDKRKKS